MAENFSPYPMFTMEWSLVIARDEDPTFFFLGSGSCSTEEKNPDPMKKVMDPEGYRSGLRSNQKKH